MARKFLTPIDLNKNEIQNGVVHNIPGTTGPATPVKGQMYFDSTGNILYWYNGSGWVAAQGGAGAVPATTVTASAVGDSATVGVATTYAREDHKHSREAFANPTGTTTFGLSVVNGSATTLARSDHTHGTPTHDAAAHSAIKVTDLALPTTAVNFNGQILNGVGTPSAGTDATNKDYVDNSVAGLAWKDAVRVASTANGTLAAAFANGQTMDGITLLTGDRILLKDQSTGSQNGIYTVNTAGAPTRALDSNTGAELESASVFVMEGTTNADKAFTMTTNGPITPDTTALVWVQFGASTTYVAGNGITLTGNSIDVVGDASITVTADQISRAALTGNVTAPAGSNATTIATGVVANSMLATMPANTLKMNNTAGVASPTDVTIANAQTALGIPTTATLDAAYLKRFAADCVASATTTVTHNFNTRDVMVQVYQNSSTWDEVEVDIKRTTVNAVDVTFASAPTAGQYRIVVVGLDQ